MSSLTNPFVLILFILPAINIVLTVIAVKYFIKKVYWIGIITFGVYFLLTFTVFNSSFLIWVIVYTAINVLLAFMVLRGNDKK